MEFDQRPPQVLCFEALRSGMTLRAYGLRPKVRDQVTPLQQSRKGSNWDTRNQPFQTISAVGNVLAELRGQSDRLAEIGSMLESFQFRRFW